MTGVQILGEWREQHEECLRELADCTDASTQGTLFGGSRSSQIGGVIATRNVRLTTTHYDADGRRHRMVGEKR